MTVHTQPKAATPLTELKMSQVADLVYKQKTTAEIAEIMQLSTQRVQEYIRAIRDEWREHRLRTAEEHFDEQLARLAYLEKLLMPKCENGYVPAFERMLQLYDQRNKLEGLYAPAKSELDIGEQLTKLLTRISTEPEPERLALREPATTVEGDYTDIGDS